MGNTQLDRRLVEIVPSKRQLDLQQMEMYAFAHFTVNTFTGREWGDGAESPALFSPARFDPDQWAEAVKAAGMKGLILTCKHHDGFCLWPSRYTSHTVASSPWRGGRGDAVRETAEACRWAGLRFGVYLSPWDRNQPCYGEGKAYDDFFVAQLTELLTGYGEIFTVWLDGACGEGPGGKRQRYDWDRYYETVRRLQPGACLSVCGPDVRWCGNEAGDVRESEWSVVPERTRDSERVEQDSQQEDSSGFRERKIRASDRDLGSRRVLKGEDRLIWYPAETDVSIRPGWFYHPEEDGRVKTAEELFQLYLSTVGGNSTLLLNIPPTPEGRFAPQDVESLRGLGELVRRAFSRNLLQDAQLSADRWEPGHGAEQLRQDSYEEWYQGTEGPGPWEIRAQFPAEREVRYVKLKENIRMSQRIERFRLLADGVPVAAGTTVGYQKILALPAGLRARTLVLQVEDARVCPTLSFFGAYGD